GPASRVVVEDDVHLKGRVSPRVQDLPGMHRFNGRHRRLLSLWTQCLSFREPSGGIRDQNNGHAGERADGMESERPRSSYQTRLTEILWIKARDAPRSRASVRLPEEQCMSFRLGLALMDEQTIQDFWQNHACGDALVGGLEDRFGGDYEQFF